MDGADHDLSLNRSRLRTRKNRAASAARFFFVHAFEPPSVGEVLRHGFDGAFGEAGFSVVRRRTLARGMARIWVGEARD